MGMLFTVVITFIVIALGVGKIVELFTPKTKITDVGNISVSDKEIPQVVRTAAIKNPKINTLITVLNNEGYMGRVKLPDEKLTPVTNHVISQMVSELALEMDLVWVLPMYGLRIRDLADFPISIQGIGTYTHLLLTPTHAIGFDIRKVTKN